MTATGFSVMAEFRHARPRDRLSAFFCSIYGFGGDNRDKHLARDLAISDRAARNLFEGHWPGDETWAAIVRRFGDRVLRVVFAPEIEPVLADLVEKEARLDRELEAIRARRREVQGAVGDHPHRREGDRGQAGTIEAQLGLFDEDQP